jgi:hypothetical protein
MSGSPTRTPVDGPESYSRSTYYDVAGASDPSAAGLSDPSGEGGTKCRALEHAGWR